MIGRSFVVKLAGQIKSKVGAGQNLHLKDSRQHPGGLGSCLLYSHSQGYPRRFSDLRPIGAPFPAGPGRIGKRGISRFKFRSPDSGRVGNRGFPGPPRFPAKSGIGGTGIRDFRVCHYSSSVVGSVVDPRPGREPASEPSTRQLMLPPKQRPSHLNLAARF
jgi:hypothetical protein